MLGIPENEKEFNYGFKFKDDKVRKYLIIISFIIILFYIFLLPIQNKNDTNQIEQNPYPEDAYLMVSQLHWEDDIIWNGNDKKYEVLQKLSNNTNSAGWILHQPNKGTIPLAGGSVCLATNSPFM